MEPLVAVLEHIGKSAMINDVVRQADDIGLARVLLEELHVDVNMNEFKYSIDQLDVNRDIVCFILGPGKEHEIPKEDNKPPAEDEPFDDDELAQRSAIA